MRAIWSGAIGFGLVNIPVKMYSAVEDSTLGLDMLDKHDLSNIRFKRINEHTGKEVAYKDIVKGYKVEGDYVVLEEDDFKAAAPEKSQVIAIEEFVEASEIDPAYFEAPYYLGPEKSGERPYALLREALEKSGKLAIGSYVMRSKEHLCALRPYKDIIMLLRLRFAEELRDTKDISGPKPTIKPAEMKMATSLIDQLTEKKFNLDKYKDTYHADLMKIIHQKAKGKPLAKPKFKLTYSKNADLMEQLKASLGAKPAKKKKAA